MPRTTLGQQISFGIAVDPDSAPSDWVWIHVKKGDTIASIAALHANPLAARTIADENGIRSVYSKFSGHAHGKQKIKVPGELADGNYFNVLAGDQPPRITDGYAKIGTVDRPEQTGLTTFEGYNPITMEVPIRFEGFHDGEGMDIERDIALLERMAGRGNFPGAATGPPPIIRVTTTDGSPRGKTVPLIPASYQQTRENTQGPLWLISGIDWDPDPIRNSAGNRIRQLATVTLQQRTRATLLTSVAARAKAKHKKKR